MKFIVIDEKNGDLFNTECETKEKALAEAEYQWNHLTDTERKNRTSFYVLESVNADEYAENHFDGDIIKSYK